MMTYIYDKCPRCGSDNIFQDVVDVGVGNIGGPAGCGDCEWTDDQVPGPLIEESDVPGIDEIVESVDSVDGKDKTMSEAPISDDVRAIATKYDITPYDLGRLACNFNPPKRDPIGVFCREIGLNPYAITSEDYKVWDKGYAKRAKEIIDSQDEFTRVLREAIFANAGVEIDLERDNDEDRD